MQNELIERAEIERGQAEMEGTYVAWDDEAGLADYENERASSWVDFEPAHRLFDVESDECPF